MANRAKLTPTRKRKFIEALSLGYSATAAAKACGLSRRCIYDHRSKDPDFAREWEEAYEAGTDRLEDALVNRAVQSDTTALIFALKGRRPERWRERFENINYNKEVPHDAESICVAAQSLPAEEYAKLRDKLCGQDTADSTGS